MNLLNRIRAWFAPPTPQRQVPASHGLDAICAQYHCTYDRTIFPTGEVQLRLLRADATLSAVGPTTADALTALTKKVHACWGAL